MRQPTRRHDSNPQRQPSKARRKPRQRLRRLPPHRPHPCVDVQTPGIHVCPQKAGPHHGLWYQPAGHSWPVAQPLNAAIKAIRISFLIVFSQGTQARQTKSMWKFCECVGQSLVLADVTEGDTILRKETDLTDSGNRTKNRDAIGLCRGQIVARRVYSAIDNLHQSC